MSDAIGQLTYFRAVVIVGVFIVLLSLLAIPIKGPESWVTEWTVWLAYLCWDRRIRSRSVDHLSTQLPRISKSDEANLD